ncbi:hypothetical protein NP233_g9461 [Leucocoprinus birnbaumii]|uniref:Uncharacterized protein n=1 Tax=Leucocoprinus birnbaumii TaxID=56174 RepID=A0AAD5VKB7_9AGAR|nr:hypothetical protein NP233_g9461 [Leucocoprinus birnbaumii]
MVFDSFIDSLRAWTSRFGRDRKGKASKPEAARANRHGVRSGEGTSESTPPPGFFDHASNFSVQQSKFTNINFNNNTYNMFANGNTGAPLHPPRRADARDG